MDADVERREYGGEMRAVFGLSDGEPGLALCDSTGEPHGTFNLDKGQPFLGLRDSAGKEIWKAP